ncbi:MAG: hypothetical protein ACFCUQ_18640 [Kiloniellales bacterium]
MTKLLPQQRLLLELLVLSGEIAVPGDTGESVLWRTVQECLDNKWLLRHGVGGGFYKLSVTERGRAVLR